MEKMPYSETSVLETQIMPEMRTTEVASSDWRQQLPVLAGQQVRLRELRVTDAPSLFAMLTTEEVSRFISPPPTTVEGFERFIGWGLRHRTAGDYVCFAVTVAGYDTAVGIFQIRSLDANFEVAEWGFALGSPFWGTGVFEESARLVLDFAFDKIGARRLEARVAVKNGRGHGAIHKLRAMQEAVMRKSFQRHGEYHDQVLYSILDTDWNAARVASSQIRFEERVH